MSKTIIRRNLTPVEQLFPMAKNGSARRPERRWSVLPPIPHTTGTGLLGARVLEEHPGELGGILWQCLQSTMTWADAPVAERPGLFQPGAEGVRTDQLRAAQLEPALEQPLGVLVALLARPEQVPAEQVALACTRIAQWAGARGSTATQLEFAHAATRACPGDAVFAIDFARLHGDRGAYLVAEGWYQWTVGLARQARDWATYTRAHIGLGKIFQARGAYPAGRKSLLRALRAAERRGLPGLRASALHDLFTVELECDRFESAERYAEAALEAYGPGHPGLPLLAADIAIYWMARGQFAGALPVIRRVLPHVEGPLRLVALGYAARAAGAVGDGATCEAAFRELSAAPDDAARKIDGMEAAAFGAASLGRLDEAEHTARWVLTLAARGDHKMVFTMEALLEKIGRLRHATSGSTVVESTPAIETPASSLALADTLDRLLAPIPAGAAP